MARGTATFLNVRPLLLAGVAMFATAAAHAQVVLVPPTPQIGSSNLITAEPPVSRPHARPCVVQLFQNLQFADFNTKSFSDASRSARSLK